MQWSCLGVVGLLIFSGSALAAKKSKGPPSAIAHIFPAGGKTGTSFSIAVAGTFTQNPTTPLADHPGITLKATAKPSVFDVTLAPDVPLGPHLLRFYNDDGASPPRIFMVGLGAERLRKETTILQR